MSTKGLAFKYVSGQLRGDRDNTGEVGRIQNTVRAGHNGALLAMHSAAPQGADVYEAWLSEALSDDPRGKAKVTAAKLRRAVLMRRNGRTWEEVRVAVGCASINEWIARLPAELRP